MDHVAGVPASSSSRMSPQALGLAVLLHILAAAALWWAVANRPTISPVLEPVELVIEQARPPEVPPAPPPAPPQPAPEPARQPPPQPAPQPAPPLVIEGLRPPAEIIDEQPTQVRPSGDQAKDIAGPPPRSLEQEIPDPPPPVPAPNEAVLRPPPPPPPKPAPTPPALTPHPQPQPTPQITRPQERPAAIARREEPPSLSPLVNPADARNTARASDNYLWQVARKLTRHYETDRPVGVGYLAVRLVIARNGRLLEADLVQSSGVSEIDRVVMAAVRAGSPYAPLPPEIVGDRASFVLPLTSTPAAPPRY